MLDISDKLHTPDNIVVLRPLYPYGIITFGYNKQNGEDAPCQRVKL